MQASKTLSEQEKEATDFLGNTCRFLLKRLCGPYCGIDVKGNTPGCSTFQMPPLWTSHSPPTCFDGYQQRTAGRDVQSMSRHFPTILTTCRVVIKSDRYTSVSDTLFMRHKPL